MISSLVLNVLNFFDYFHTKKKLEIFLGIIIYQNLN